MQIQVAALAASPSALPALLADRDEALKQQTLVPIVTGTLELGRSVELQIDRLSQSLADSLAIASHLHARSGEWSAVGEPVAWETCWTPWKSGIGRSKMRESPQVRQ